MHIKYFTQIQVECQHLSSILNLLSCFSPPIVTLHLCSEGFLYISKEAFISDMFSGGLFSSAAVYFQSPGLQRVSPSEAQMHGVAVGYSF